MLKLFKRFKEFLNRLFCTVGSVDYMVALPSPLSADDEQKYLRLNAEGDKDAFNTLIEHNLRLVVYIAKRFDNTGVDQEELISVGTMGLISFFLSICSSENSFSISSSSTPEIPYFRCTLPTNTAAAS